jgi:anaerobic magnesium-protoporphyrin IX monomethyl ester cyclase
VTDVECLFAHSWFVSQDHRPGHMHPLPPLQPAELAAWLTREAHAVCGSWDSTFRLGPEEFEIAASRIRPRVVWLYTHPTTRASAHRMVAIARQSGAVVLAGGPDASLRPDDYLRAGADAVLPGECEDALLQVVLALRAAHHKPSPELFSRVPGLVYLDGHEVRRSGGQARTVPIEQLPWPLREREATRIHLERWRGRMRYRPMALSSARGCPVSCGFCTHTVFGRPHRRRDPADVVSEMVSLVQEFDVDRFVFADELFLVDPHWLREFAARLAERNPRVAFEGRAHPTSIDLATLRLLNKVGLDRVSLLATSGSHDLLQRLQWSHRPSHTYRAVQCLRDAGVRMGLELMVGLPGERRADLDASMELVRVAEPDGVEVIRVDPGSPALFRQDWERVIAGPVAERGEPGTAGPAQDAAVRWMQSVGARDDDPVDRLRGRVASVERPLLRAAIRLLPGRS